MTSRDYPTRPWVGVGVVVTKGRDVLMIRRGKPPRQGQWSLPGGVQELGETVRETAVREVLEETGIEIALGPIADVVDSVTRDDDGRVLHHYTLVDFSAVWVAGEPRAGDDAQDARWFSLAELKAETLWPETLRLIKAVLREIKSSGF